MDGHAVASMLYTQVVQYGICHAGSCPSPPLVLNGLKQMCGSWNYVNIRKYRYTVLNSATTGA